MPHPNSDVLRPSISKPRGLDEWIELMLVSLLLRPMGVICTSKYRLIRGITTFLAEAIGGLGVSGTHATACINIVYR